MNNSPFIVAFDCVDLNAAKKLAGQLSPSMCRAKVGKELFTAVGMPVVDMLHKQGYEVFLDLKFHDIPNTVNKAVTSAVNAGVWMVNVHASGGALMMNAAKEAIVSANSDTLLIAVTVLTSMTEAELKPLGVMRSLKEQVSVLANSAKEQGLDGVVCSAREAANLRKQCGEDFLLVTPGIRPQDAPIDDQRRTCTPLEALDNGSNYLVIGRPVTQVDEPGLALEKLVNQLV